MEKEILERLDDLSINVEEIFKYLSTKEDTAENPFQDAVYEIQEMSKAVTESQERISSNITAFFDSFEGINEVSDSIDSLTNKLDNLTFDTTPITESLETLTLLLENRQSPESPEILNVVADIEGAISDIPVSIDVDTDRISDILSEINFKPVLDTDNLQLDIEDILTGDSPSVTPNIDYSKLEELKTELENLNTEIYASVNIEYSENIKEIADDIDMLREMLSEDIDISNIESAVSALESFSIDDTGIGETADMLRKSLESVKTEIDSIEVDVPDIDIKYNIPEVDIPEITTEQSVIQVNYEEPVIEEEPYTPEFITPEVDTSAIEEKLDLNNTLLQKLSDIITNLEPLNSTVSETVITNNETENTVKIGSEASGEPDTEIISLLREISEKLTANKKPKLSFDTKTNFD